ncbi:hypothetical protein [Paenibacillus alvei]|uniref:hypothetical protein n=1 Tax=Paenibacillus alvei TaxID=44250 RepID=UPI00157FE44C|nr:hypothetical protein [Paenibacillus alvei]
MSSIPNLQPLRIPSSWIVTYNGFICVDPQEILGNDQRWLSFTQELLHLTHLHTDLILDLGWSPEADPNGYYNLSLIKDKDWFNPLKTYSTKSKQEVVKLIESTLWEYANGR